MFERLLTERDDIGNVVFEKCPDPAHGIASLGAGTAHAP
jgi:hypothetical protein